jgi:hypothetical protein
MMKYRPQRTTCPTCGKRTVKVRYYKNGDTLYVHSVKHESTPFGVIVNLNDSCYVKAQPIQEAGR